MVDPEPLTLEIPGLRLEALAWGPADGLPVLAVHGWLDNAASFARLAPLLPGVRLVAVDLPGHGLSEHRPAGAAYHFIDWVVDLAAAGEALGWERYVLLGHSMGAGVVSLLAGALPERVLAMALIEGLGPMACEADEAPARLAKAILRRDARERKRPRPHADRATAAARLREVNPNLGEEAARLLVERGTREVSGEASGVVWRSDSRLRGLSPLRITEAHVRAFLARVACPTLLVRGQQGYPFDPGTIAGRLAALRRVPGGPQVEELAGGHHLHLDRPEAVAGVLNPLLERARTSGPLDVPDAARPSREVTQERWVTLETLRLLEGVKLVALDVDGVLTAGRLDYGPDGHDRLEFSVRDGLGIKLLQRAGIEVALVSGRAPDVVRARARDLGIQHVHLGIEHKLPRLDELLAELRLERRHVAYMGDDLVDLPVLRVVGYGAAPADAHPLVRREARYVTEARGGRGAVRELAEHLLKAQGRWDEVVSRYR